MAESISIAGRKVGEGHKPFVIAELSGNHNQELALAKQMVAAAAESGVDAIKLQTYTADSMTLAIDSDNFRIQEKDSLWYGAHLHELYQQACTPYEWHGELFEYANSLGLIAFSSPFDEDAVDFLESLNVPCYKIASFELTDLPLIKKAALTGKPIIMSTGMASIEEIEQALATAYATGNKQVILLKCTSTYPASPENTHLSTITDMQQRFSCNIGLSDHTRGIGVAVASVALGACVIEKHFVLDRNAGGVDAAFSLEPREFAELVENSQQAFSAMGQVTYGGSAAEEKSKYYRRSIFVTQDVKAGEVIDKNNVKIVRPAIGLAPKYLPLVLGQTFSQDLTAGSALFSEHIVDFKAENE
ncbi:N-acylneuraminate-9-phosphate synthase [Catenovulum agarivorans DS-2]|uniref:N-acylneuraminate-9-phosphate synthase n=1 Tax=Catenovulum agarivorans DS-2 TaxID=1328313 RepID=W7QKI5_9ALTE|nr:pseudaminic acid synthase [Catenovulum agarivorans]EWH09472.1 N-acylneuraminate-9-phosphate synthase [Catenovulum agarivorans DS-2]